MRRTPIAAKRGTQAHLDEIRAREIALGLIVDDAPAPAAPVAPEPPVVDESEPFDIDAPLDAEISITRTDDEPVITPNDEAQALFELGATIMQPRAPVDEKDGSGLLELLKASYARPMLDRAQLAELEAAYIDSAAYAAGIPFLTCRLYPSQSGMRTHHAHWRMVYWRDSGETRGAWRCLKCYPELEKFGLTSARVAEVREIERRLESERQHVTEAS